MAKGVEDFLFAFGFLSLCGWDADAAVFRGWKWGWREDIFPCPLQSDVEN